MILDLWVTLRTASAIVVRMFSDGPDGNSGLSTRLRAFLMSPDGRMPTFTRSMSSEVTGRWRQVSFVQDGAAAHGHLTGKKLVRKDKFHGATDDVILLDHPLLRPVGVWLPGRKLLRLHH